MTDWQPELGDWVVVMPPSWKAGRIGQVGRIGHPVAGGRYSSQPAWYRVDTSTDGGPRPVWAPVIRPATLEEIAGAQLASLPGGRL